MKTLKQNLEEVKLIGIHYGCNRNVIRAYLDMFSEAIKEFAEGIKPEKKREAYQEAEKEFMLIGYNDAIDDIQSKITNYFK